jgi:hypothetical protein
MEQISCTYTVFLIDLSDTVLQPRDVAMIIN